MKDNLRANYYRHFWRNVMKISTICFILLLSINLKAQIIPGTNLGNIKPLDSSWADPDQEYFYEELVNNLPLNELLTKAAITTGGLDPINCFQANFIITKFKSKSNQIYYAIYSSDDWCDGGSSIGMVIDELFIIQAVINEGEFIII